MLSRLKMDGKNENSEIFAIKTGVRQGCNMSSVLFLLVMDWVMRKTTEDKKRGIRWNMMKDLDCADDLCLTSHTYREAQEKMEKLNNYAKQVGIKINNKKTKTMCVKTERNMNLRIEQEEVDLNTLEQS